jgi:hypothetical protein
VDNNYLDLGTNKSGFVHTLPVGLGHPYDYDAHHAHSFRSFRHADIAPLAMYQLSSLESA